MPLQARVYIRTALLHGLIAFLLGAMLLINQALNIYARLAAFQPVFYHLLMVGWVLQMIFGVAWWMFPLQSREQGRGNELLGWIAFGLLNSGLILRAIFEPWQAWGGWSWPLVLAALNQLAAVWLWIIALWPRVKDRARPGKR